MCCAVCVVSHDAILVKLLHRCVERIRSEVYVLPREFHSLVRGVVEFVILIDTCRGGCCAEVRRRLRVVTLPRC